ncbi:MAG: hypothetical protein QOJ65_2574, partial [Fimbriimonadaceae bacterium]|nr:hypothetical protein [Fimbriimonadaceae bacterium]
DREVLKREELVEAFTMDGLQPSSGVFDVEKFQWMNGVYIRETPTADLIHKLRQFVKDRVVLDYWEAPAEEGAPVKPDMLPQLGMLQIAFERDPEYAGKAVALEQERVQTLPEFGPATAFFFEDEPPMDQKAVAKWFGQPHVSDLFDYLIERLNEPRASLPGLSASTGASVEWCETLIRHYATEKGFDKLGPVVHPVRVALTGKTVGPGLFELMSVLGPERMLTRLQRARALVR